jgi:hypothetical protein
VPHLRIGKQVAAGLRPARKRRNPNEVAPGHGDHRVDTAKEPIRDARDVRDLPAARWPAPALSNPFSRVAPDLARGERVEARSGSLASIQRAARITNVPRPRLRSRLPARPGSRWPAASASRSGSKSPASIRQVARITKLRRHTAARAPPGGRNRNGAFPGFRAGFR